MACRIGGPKRPEHRAGLKNVENLYGVFVFIC